MPTVSDNGAYTICTSNEGFNFSVCTKFSYHFLIIFVVRFVSRLFDS